MASPTKAAPSKPGAKGKIAGLPWWAWGLAIVAGLAIGYFVLRPRAAAAASDSSPPSGAPQQAGGGGGAGAGLGLPGEGLPGTGGGGTSFPSSGSGGGGGGGDSAASEVPPPEDFLTDPGPGYGQIGTTAPEVTTGDPNYPNLVAMPQPVGQLDDGGLGMASLPTTRPGEASVYTVLPSGDVHVQQGTQGGRFVE